MYDISKVKNLSPRVNKYFAKIFDYPNFLIPGFDFDEDKKVLNEILKSQDYNKLILEFGSGSGAHLISLAEMNPENFVLGFELRFKRSVRTIEKAKNKKINNICVFRGRSEKCKELLDDTKADEIYINFPDPWAKKRWHKHRILSPDNISMLGSVLTQNGIISIKTDHQEYFATFIEETQKIKDLPFKIEYSTTDLKEINIPEANIKTEFEKLFRSQNKPICYTRLVKI